MLKVLYFARLRESLGTSSEVVEPAPMVRDVAALMEWLRSRGAPWSEELASGRTVRVSVNLQMAEATTPLRDGDEVALFPPVTGG